MIFKPSSLHKLFFTYICPRFYGGAPAAPSNTTSTQTVNQSPWQNPVYQALMLGTADKPGPATSMLNASREQMAQWNAINKLGVTPVAQASLGTWNPTVSAGTSTIVDKVNQQTGKYNPTINPALYQKDATGQYVPTAPAAPVFGAAQGGLMGLRGYASGGDLQKAAKAAWGRDLTASELAEWTQHQPNTPYDTVLSRMQGYPEGVQYKATQAATKKANQPSDAEIKKYVQDNINNPQLIAGTAAKYGLSNQDLATATGYSIDKVNSFIAGTTGTPPYGLMDTMKRVAYFDPVTGKSTLPDFLDIQNTARNLKTPEQFAAATDMYGKSTAGLEAAAGYKPTKVSASKANVAKAASQGYKAANIQGAADVNTPTAAAAQMQGPASWLDQGVSAAYMSPYMQNVVDIQKREADRDYQQQLNQLNAQSVHAGAFGGSRQAIQQAEAARNQATRLGDIQAKGQQDAYASGMGQFTTEQGQIIDVGKTNLATDQQTRLANQQYQSTTDLANQQKEQQTQKANQEAENTAFQFTSGAQNAATLANQQAENTANNAYTQQQLTAQQGNQQAGLTANQQGIGALQGIASNASGLTSTGSAANAANLTNLGAQGQVTQAEQNLGQSYLDAQSGNATSYLNAPTSINAGIVNTLGGQNVQGGANTITATGAPGRAWARGGLIKNGKVSKGSKK